MGQGEPFDNTDEVMRALEVLTLAKLTGRDGKANEFDEFLFAIPLF